jgi:hypothetical protein
MEHIKFETQVIETKVVIVPSLCILYICSSSSTVASTTTTTSSVTTTTTTTTNAYKEMTTNLKA